MIPHPEYAPPDPEVEAFFDAVTATVTYIVHHGHGSACAIIDPVLDYDPKSGRTSTASTDKLIAFVKAHDLKLEWILETHAHADHVTAAPYLKSQLGGRTGIGLGITRVQQTFKTIFNLEPGFATDGSQFDRLFADGDSFDIGALRASVMAVPGHTPACIAYVIGDTVFVGDTIFMPDVGTARTDFPGGDASTLYRSIHRVLALPPQTRLFVCHDYPPGGARPVRFQTTVAEELASNIHVHEGISEDQFVDMRTKRDATLAMPVLLLPAIQLNIRAGAMPPAEPNGVSYLKIPLNAL